MDFITDEFDFVQRIKYFNIINIRGYNARAILSVCA